MTSEEALKELVNLKQSNYECVGCMHEKEDDCVGQCFDAYDKAIEALEKQDADGCTGCVFIDTEEWEMPCAKCKRGCKDYWRAKHDE